MSFKKLFIVLVILYITANAYCSVNDWLAYANTMSRESIAVDGPNIINSNTLEWDAYIDPQDPNYPVVFERDTGPIVYNGRVYTYAAYFEPNEQSPYGRDYTNSQIIAYDINSGELLWWTKIDGAASEMMSSWSTPCIDTKNNTVLIGSGSMGDDGYIATGKVYAIDAVTGAIAWTTQLYGPVVNASICVAVDIPNARAFITDYNLSDNGRLYCINLDENGPNNPYQPGEIVWSHVIGYTCGNSPAYRNGVIYVPVTSIGDYENWHGAIIAYDATAFAAVRLWSFTNPDYEAFFGGVVTTRENFLYAVTFDFWGDGDNSTLFKINCNDGSVVWTIPTLPTDVVPVIAGDRIYVSGGDSASKVEAYQDNGNSASKLWETDPNLSIGGWTNQPVYANGKLYVGARWNGGSYDELYILNTSLPPQDNNFIIAHYTDWWCGNSPAVTYDSIYAIGADGLFKFHQPALLADIDKNSIVNFYDLAELAAVWLYDGSIGIKRADLNLDGKVNFEDFSLLAGSWYGKLD